MKVLFLTLLDFDSIKEHNIYTDLLREFVKNGHEIYAVSPVERKKKQETHLIEENNVHILRLKIGNTQKTNIIEKGISTILLEPTFIWGIKKYFSHIKFDLILYSTPPITFCGAIEYVKKRDHAKTYLLLKDIFPQNAVDMGMLSKTGIKGIMYKFFRNKEKQLYTISDRIGCMSQANVDYVIAHNPEVNPEVVEICPNCIEIQDMTISEETKVEIRNKYGIPLDKTVFVYGGNLGKPQGVPFLIECLKTQETNKDAFFLIVGDGTEFGKLQDYFGQAQPQNMKLMRSLPKDDYDKMIAACDIGLIILDYRFTIPNFPSRLLSYMQAGLPVLAATDTNTDIGQIISENVFGWWCESNDVKNFHALVKSANRSDLDSMGENGYRYLERNYSVCDSYRIIMENIQEKLIINFK